MNRYIFIHRLTGPAILVLLGVVALLSQAHLVHLSIFLPLLLILLGVLKLAERAALAQYSNIDSYSNPYFGAGNYGPADPYREAAPYGSDAAQPYNANSSTPIVPPHQNGSDADEGKL